MVNTYNICLQNAIMDLIDTKMYVRYVPTVCLEQARNVCCEVLGKKIKALH